MDTPEWMNDELVKEIPKEKLQLLYDMQTVSNGKNGKQALSALLPLLKKAKEQNLTFTKEEMNAAINAIKKHTATEELQSLNQVLQSKGLHVDFNQESN